MKNCSEIKCLIALFIDDELTDEERTSFEMHIRDCAQCRQEADEIKQVVDLCRDMEDVELPADFKEELHRKLVDASRQETGSRILSMRKRYLKVFSSVAAAIMLVFVVKGLYDNGFLASRISGRSMRSESAMEAPQNFMASAAKEKESVTGGGQVQFDMAAADTQAQAPAVETKKSEAGRNGDAMLKAMPEETLLSIKESLTNRKVGIVIKIPVETDAGQQAEKIRSFAMENGAEPAEDITEEDGTFEKARNASPDISGETAISLQGETVRSQPAAVTFNLQGEIVLNLKILNSEYDRFIGTLTASFGGEDGKNVQVGPVTVTDVTEQVYEMNNQLSKLNKEIADMEGKDEASAPEIIEKAKIERDMLLKEAEKMEIDSKYTYISLTLTSE